MYFSRWPESVVCCSQCAFQRGCSRWQNVGRPPAETNQYLAESGPYERSETTYLKNNATLHLSNVHLLPVPGSVSWLRERLPLFPCPANINGLGAKKNYCSFIHSTELKINNGFRVLFFLVSNGANGFHSCWQTIGPRSLTQLRFILYSTINKFYFVYRV